MGGGIKRYRAFFLVLMILGIAAFARTKGLMNPLLDDQGWRQADTASMGWHMLGRLTELPQVWFPTLNYDGTVPQRVELEFPFLPYLLAWTWTLVGWSDLWGRIGGILFSLFTVWGIFMLGQKCFSIRSGLWAAGIYALLPLSVYYGRVVMPEPVAQAFTVWALYALLLWREKPGQFRLIVAGSVMAFAILAKLPQLMIFPAGIVLGFWPFKGSGKRIFGYSILALGLPMIYYSWVHWGAPQASQFVSGILTGQVVEGPKLFWQELRRHLREGVGMTVLVLAGVGGIRLLWVIYRRVFQYKRENTNPPFYVLIGVLLWSIITLSYVLVVCTRISLDYYLVPILLPLALLAGYALDQLEDIPGFVAGILVLALLAVNGTIAYEKKYVWDERYLTQAVWIQENTPGDSILILSDPPPMTFYYARRVGYRLTQVGDQKAWDQLTSLQGDYIVALPHTTRSPEFWRKVQASFAEVGPGVYQVKNQKQTTEVVIKDRGK